MTYHLCIVDDQEANLNCYRDLLEDDFHLNLFSKPEELLDFLLHENKSDLALLDLHMPGLNGFELFERIKNIESSLPIIFMTADPTQEKLVKGLSLGADDYIVKPVPLEELKARIINKIISNQKANSLNGDEIITFDSFKLYHKQQLVILNNQKVELTPIEFRLLHLLAKNPNKVISREKISSHLWPTNKENKSTIDTHLSNLRRKLKPFSQHIKTLKSRGYSLRI